MLDANFHELLRLLHPLYGLGTWIDIILVVIYILTVFSIFLDHALILRYFSSYKWFYKRKLQHVRFYPRISIITPVKGVDFNAYNNFKAWATQNYPAEYEYIFAVHSLDDPVVPLIKKLQSEFPNRQIRLVVSSENHKYIGKVNNLIAAEKVARFDFLVLADSDVCPEPKFLTKVIAPFVNDFIGLATCIPLYQGAKDLASSLTSTMVNANSSLVLAPLASLGMLKTAIGSCLIVRRQSLLELGGFEAIAEHIADDHCLAQKMAEIGYHVHLSNNPVYVQHYNESIIHFWRHMKRWLITMRHTAPLIYKATALRFGMFTTTIAWICNHFDSQIGFLLLFMSILRIISYIVINGLYFKNHKMLHLAILSPLLDFIVPFIWIRALITNTVEWRGQTYRVLKGGYIERVDVTDVADAV